MRLISDLGIRADLAGELFAVFCLEMAVILETLSLRSLLAFAFLLVGILITFFVVGGKIGEWEANNFV